MNYTAKYLNVECPECKAQLYGWYHEASDGDPSTGTWNVECSRCEYKPEEHVFATQFSLSTWALKQVEL